MINEEKKYQKAFERAKEYYDSVNTSNYERRKLETIFPELKKSEYERIRKEFIRYVKEWQKGHCIWNSDKDFCNAAVAWLEKQGEQKPTDKVESKFKAGDFITDGKRIFQIKETVWERNNRNDGSTYCESLIVNLRDGITYADNTDLKEYHLWTIQDAKDGDVLYECNEKKPFIFKELKTKHIGDIASYCDIFNGVFNSIGDKWTTLDIVPSTKEQCDLLFQKMKEAGYAWDAEKKELKKIEQESTWNEKIKGLNELEGYILSLVPDRPLDAIKVDVKNIRCIIDKEQNPAWSEEDEKMLLQITQYLISLSEECKVDLNDRLNWLKSIKERMKGK